MSTELVAAKANLNDDAQTWAARAREVRIVDADSCTRASELLKSIKGLRLQISRWFEPHVEAAMETKRKAEAARKALADERDRMEAPLVDAEQRVKRALLDYEAEQERLRQAEERRLQEEAQRQAEAVTLAAAAEMEAEAARTGDAALRAEAENLIEQPTEAPAVSVARTVPTTKGVTYRDRWKAHPTVDVKALAAAVARGQAPLNFLTPNMTAINAYAVATKGTQTVPGVRWINDREIAVRG